MADLFQDDQQEDIVITITIKQGKPEHLDVSYNMKNMLTMQDAATVSHVLGNSSQLILNLVKQNMPKSVKAMKKLPETQQVAFMKSQRLTFMLDGK